MSVIICPFCKKQTSISLEECIHCGSDVTLAIKEFKIKSEKEQALDANNIFDNKIKNLFFEDKISLDEAKSKQDIVNKEKKEKEQIAAEKRKAAIEDKFEKEQEASLKKTAQNNSGAQGCGCGCLTYLILAAALGVSSDDGVEMMIIMMLGLGVFFLVKKFAYGPNYNLAKNKVLEKQKAELEHSERLKQVGENKIIDKKVKADFLNKIIDLNTAIAKQDKINKKKVAQKKKEAEAKKKAAEVKAKAEAEAKKKAKAKAEAEAKKKAAEEKKKKGEDDLLDSFLDD